MADASQIHNIIMQHSKLFNKFRPIVKLEKGSGEPDKSKVLSIDKPVLDPDISEWTICRYVAGREEIHRGIAVYLSVDVSSSDTQDKLADVLEKAKNEFNQILDSAVIGKNSKGFLSRENVAIDYDENDTLWKSLADKSLTEKPDALVRLDTGKKKILVRNLINPYKK